MNGEKYKPEQINKQEKLKTEVTGLMQNVSALKNVISILGNAGLSALKTIFKR